MHLQWRGIKWCIRGIRIYSYFIKILFTGHESVFFRLFKIFFILFIYIDNIKWQVLSSKDVINWSIVAGKTFMMIYSYLKKIIKTNIHENLMVSEGSCNTKDWSYDAKNVALHHSNTLYFKINSHRKHLFKILIIFHNITVFYCVFIK